MGLSETILAAIIGALATMATAIVQLMRNRAPSDGRPKPKKNRMRSMLAIIALMIGCIVGGYAWSALRAVSAKEEIDGHLQAEFARQFAEFAARQTPTTAQRPTDAAAHADRGAATARAGSAESVAHLPPCRVTRRPKTRVPPTCTEPPRQTVALCATVPASAAHHQRARAGARAEERIGLGRTRCRCADARQPAHRRGAPANTR